MITVTIEGYRCINWFLIWVVIFVSRFRLWSKFISRLTRTWSSNPLCYSFGFVFWKNFRWVRLKNKWGDPQFKIYASSFGWLRSFITECPNAPKSGRATDWACNIEGLKRKKGSPLELPFCRMVERPVAQALCLNGGKEVKTIRADMNHQSL